MRLLLDVDLEQTLPRLYEQRDKKQKTLYVRFYHPIYNYEWYAMEYSPLQRLFYGLIEGDLTYGYFTLDELVRLGVKRDYDFAPLVLQLGELYGNDI